MASSKDRERELARRRHQRQLERKAAQQAKFKQRMIIASVVAAVIAVILALVVTEHYDSGSGKSTAAGGTPSGSTTPTGSTTPSTAGSPTGAAPATTAAGPAVNPSPTISGGAPLTCTTPPAKQAKPQTFAKEPAMTIDPKATYTATITTNCGVIKAELDAAKAPHTVNSFNFLAGKGYFTDSPCHRVTTSGIYVLQCGDPTGTGSGGPGYTIPDENLTGATYGPGVLAMANTGQAHTGGSQFFINYQASQLPATYTPFGTVTEGLDIVQAIAAKGAAGGNGDGAPNQPISIESFTVTKS